MRSLKLFYLSCFGWNSEIQKVVGRERVVTIDAIFCLTASGIQSADARWNLTSALVFTEKKNRTFFNVMAWLPKIYDVIQSAHCWLWTYDDSSMHYLKDHIFFLLLLLQTIPKDNFYGDFFMVFAFLYTMRFNAITSYYLLCFNGNCRTRSIFCFVIWIKLTVCCIGKFKNPGGLLYD